MSILHRIRLVGLGAFSLALMSCGSASNNDQGASVTNIGYFTDTSGTTGAVGANLVLGADRPQVIDANGILVDGLQTNVTMGVENHLTEQFVRVVRIDCDYDVPGANPSFVIPTEQINVGTVIQETGTGFIQFPIITPDIYAILNNNRNLLPELPFQASVVCRAIVQTEAGDTLETNPATFAVVFNDAAECCTGGSGQNPDNNEADSTGGFQGGTGNGGTFVSGTTTNSGSATLGATDTTATDDAAGSGATNSTSASGANSNGSSAANASSTDA